MDPADVLYQMQQAAVSKGQQMMAATLKELDRIGDQMKRRDEEAEQRLIDLMSESEKQAKADWEGDPNKFGGVEPEEPESARPVKRVVREDSNTRSVGTSGDDDDLDVEPVVRHVRDDDWGGGTRKFGNYDEDE